MNPITHKAVPHAHIDMGILHLVIPQADIKSVELSSTIIPNKGCTPVVGYLHTLKYQWPVIVLDEDLHVQEKVSPHFRFIVCLETQCNQLRFAIPCRNVSKLSLNDEQISLPPAIKNTNIAILSAHVIEDKLCFKTSADRLLTHLSEEHDLTSVLEDSSTC